MKRTMIAGALAAWAGTAGAAESTLTENHHYNFTLSPGGSVVLKNLSGFIKVERVDGDQVLVDVEKIATGASEEEARKILDSWQIEARNSENSASLEAKPQSTRFWPDWDGGRDRARLDCNFTARVPRGAALRLDSISAEPLEIRGDGEGSVDAGTINGNIQYSGNSKDLQLHTVNGNVSAELLDFPAQGRAELKSVNGALVAFLPANASANVQAKSLQGQLYSNLPLPPKTIESFLGFEYAEKLGQGGGALRLETVSGPIRLLLPGSAPDDGKPIVELTQKSFAMPAIEFNWNSTELQESIREAQEAAMESARDAGSQAREAARIAAREAREATRNGLEQTRRALEKTRATMDGIRAGFEAAGSREGMHLSGVVSGDLNIREGKESIEIGEVEGNASLITFAGDISVGRIGGVGKLLTYGGTIEVNEAAQSLEAETYGGDIQVDKALGALTVKTRGGDIGVNEAHAGVMAETYGGDIDLQRVEGPIKAETKGGAISATLAKALSPGAGAIDLQSMGGDLELNIPKGMGATIHVELLVRPREANDHILNTNIGGLERKLEQEGDDSKIVYEGVINGGGTNITLRTKFGEITLNEE